MEEFGKRKRLSCLCGIAWGYWVVALLLFPITMLVMVASLGVVVAVVGGDCSDGGSQW